MRSNSIRYFLILALLGSGVVLADDQADVAATLDSYEKAWSAHDPRAIASFYYEPAMRYRSSLDDAARADVAMQESGVSMYRHAGVRW